MRLSRQVIHFLTKTSHRDTIYYNSKCRDSEQKLFRAFSDPLEHLVTIASVLLLPYKFKNIFKTTNIQ